MRATEIITESKKTGASKPRNFVAKNAKMGGAGKMQDKSKSIPRHEKHKQKEISEADGNKVQQIEAMISQLEQMMPAVMQLQKNHYEFEAIEDEIGSLAEPVSQLADSSARVDMQDAMENAVESIRKANGAIYEIEKALKYLIKSANYSLDDARDEAEYESRFGGPALEEEADDNAYGYKVGQTVKLTNGKQGYVIDIFDDAIEVQLTNGQNITVDFRDAEVIGEHRVAENSKDIPFAGKKVGQKEGPAGQLKGRDPKGYPKGKLVGGGM
jgi:hypothetical protein